MAGSRSTAPLNRSNSVLIAAPLSAFEICGFLSKCRSRLTLRSFITRTVRVQLAGHSEVGPQVTCGFEFWPAGCSHLLNRLDGAHQVDQAGTLESAVALEVGGAVHEKLFYFFGLADVFAADGEKCGDDAGHTGSRHAGTVGRTRAGVILGTAAYMSPEQAAGRPADRRSDIFSFGAVLYEMLAGKRAFVGSTTPDVLEAVVRNEPDWSELPADTSDTIQRLLRPCLTKDRRQRLQAIGEARIVLENPGGTDRPMQATRLPHNKLPWVVMDTARPFASMMIKTESVHKDKFRMRRNPTGIGKRCATIQGSCRLRAIPNVL